jgi:hypothetical protein
MKRPEIAEPPFRGAAPISYPGVASSPDRPVRRPGRRRRPDRLSGRRARPARALGAVVAAVTLGSLVPSTDAAFKGGTQSPPATFAAASSFYASMVKADGAAGYWRLGETSGTAAASDSSGNNRPGTYANNPNLGIPGTSQDGDTAQQTGSNAYGVLPRLVVNDYSLELWFKTTATNPTVATNWYDSPFAMLSNANGAIAGNVGVRLNGNGRVMAGSGATTLQTASAYNDGIWHHVVLTRVKSTGALTLYVDGTSRATGTGHTGTEDNSPNIGLGANQWVETNVGDFFNGYLDEVAQYPAALSSTRVTAHWNARTADSTYSNAVTTDSPLGYWRLNDATGKAATAVGSATNAGAIGTQVQRSQPGAITGSNTAMRFVPAATLTAYVPRLVSTNLTIEARFRTLQSSGNTTNWYNSNRIFGTDLAGDTTDFGMGIGSNGRLYAGTGTPDTTIASPAGTTYNDGNWHAIALTRSSTGALKLYADGVLVASGTGGTATLTASSTLGIGSDYDTNGALWNQFVGTVSDVAQYPSVLTATRLAAHVSAATSFTNYRNALVPDSPSGYWPLNDTTGTTLAASIGGATNNGYADTAVARGGAAPTGTGLDFRTANNAGAVVPRVVQNDFSLECWFNTTSGIGGPFWYVAAPLIQGDASGDVADYGMALTIDGRVVFGAVTRDTVVYSAATGLNDGQWHHAVVTRVSSTGAVKIYIDGVSSGSGTLATGTLNAASVLGLGYNPGDGRTFEGTLDEVAVYPSVLSPAKILYHYHRGT